MVRLVKLRLSQPLNLALTLQSGQAFRWRQVDLVANGGATRWWHGFLKDEPVLLAQHSANDVSMLVRCRSGAAERVQNDLRRYFRLDDDLPAVARRLSGDEHLAAAFEALHGMRLLRQDPWECLVGFLCSGHNNIKRISLMMERMAEAYGEVTELDGVRRKTFPTPERLAGASEAALRGLGLGFRAGPVALAARRVADGQFPLFALREWPYERAKSGLLDLRGVGEKIADCVLLLSLEKLEAFPIDRWVRRAVEQWYPVAPRAGRDGRPLKEAPYEQLREWAQARWGLDAGYANQYLFQGRRVEEREVGGMRAVRPSAP